MPRQAFRSPTFPGFRAKRLALPGRSPARVVPGLAEEPDGAGSAVDRSQLGPGVLGRGSPGLLGADLALACDRGCRP